MKNGAVNSTKHILTSVQVQQLRSVCDTITPGEKRDLAIIDSMLYQGMRLKEVASLRLEHILRVKDHYYIHLESRPDPVKAHSRWLQSLDDWLDQMGVSIEINHRPIFVQIPKYAGSQLKPLSSRTISFLVARYGKLAGIAPAKGSNRLFPIDLRRTCARNAYDRGARLSSVSALLGFNHLESAARFIDVLELSDPETAIDKINYYPYT
jgi:integrase